MLDLQACFLLSELPTPLEHSRHDSCALVRLVAAQGDKVFYVRSCPRTINSPHLHHELHPSAIEFLICTSPVDTYELWDNLCFTWESALEYYLRLCHCNSFLCAFTCFSTCSICFLRIGTCLLQFRVFCKIFYSCPRSYVLVLFCVCHCNSLFQC